MKKIYHLQIYNEKVTHLFIGKISGIFDGCGFGRTLKVYFCLNVLLYFNNI